MAHGVAEIHQPAFRQQDDALAVGELDLVDLRLDVVPLEVLQRGDLNLAVEMADVADDRAVLHRPHVVDGDDVEVAGRGAEDVGARRGIFHRHDFIAFHRRLQRADRIDFGDHHAAAGLAQRSGRALADVAEARDHRDLAGHHHVGAAADAVDQRFAAAIEIVELRLGDAVVDVDGGPQQLALLLHLVEPVHAGGGLFGDAADVLGVLSYQPGCSVRRFLIAANRTSSSSLVGCSSNAVSPCSARRPRWISIVASPPSSRIMFGVPPSAHSKIRCCVVPVILQALALDGEDRRAGRGDRGGGVILRRIDVAGRPADVGAERLQRLDQHRGLDRHVQRAGDARAAQRLLRAIFLARRHQARHFGLGDGRFPCGPNRRG